MERCCGRCNTDEESLKQNNPNPNLSKSKNPPNKITNYFGSDSRKNNHFFVFYLDVCALPAVVNME